VALLLQASITYLGPQNVSSFAAALAETALRGQSVKKGLNCIQSAIRRLGGGAHLSQLSREVRQIVQFSIFALQDAGTTFNTRAHHHINATEARRLLHNANRKISSHQILLNLYFLSETEYYNFLAALCSTVTAQIAKKLAGFVYLRLMLGRPATRQGVFNALELSTFQANFGPMQKFDFTVTKHKTAGSAGALFCSLPSWCTAVLWAYIHEIRPVLLASGEFKSHSDEKLLFPRKITTFLANFCHGLPQRLELSPSLIRHLFADYVGCVHLTDGKFAKYSSILVASCAHLSSSSSVSRHYQISKKIEHEGILSSFVQETLIQPSIQRVKNVHGQSLPVYDFSKAEVAQPLREDTTPIRRRKRRADVPLKSCYNKTKKKKCLSRGDAPQFANASQVSCDLCLHGYGGSGKFTPKAAKRLGKESD
jgi:hypothetical protein